MRRLMKIGCGTVVVLAVIVVAIAAMTGSSNAPIAQSDSAPAESLTMDYLEPASREGNSAGFLVRLNNATSEVVENPQIRVEVELGGRTWTCQGYVDPTTGEAIDGTDPIMRPLIIPAKTVADVTILCRIPEAPLDTARVRLR